jgi:hypothetical protein
MYNGKVFHATQKNLPRVNFQGIFFQSKNVSDLFARVFKEKNRFGKRFEASRSAREGEKGRPAKRWISWC